MSDETNTDALLQPAKLWSRREVLNTDAVPRSPGVYAWWFRQVPPGVPIEGCIAHEVWTLLYVGIAPKAPALGTLKASRATLRSRLRYQMRGNAEGSRLRLTLGCLLADSFHFELRRVSSDNRLTFGDVEERLSAWLDEMPPCQGQCATPHVNPNHGLLE